MPRKGENIYKRKDGRWEGRYMKARSDTGKAIYGYVYGKTYREAKEKLHRAIALSEQKETLPLTDSDLFSSVATQWFSAAKHRLKESTQNKYWNLLNSYILPAFGSRMLDDITCDVIEETCCFLFQSGGRAGRGLSSKTVMDTLSLIRSILKFARRRGLFIPWDGTDIQIKHNSAPMRVFSRTEQETLCLYLSENLNPCNMGILICLFTGLRIGEICALRWEDVSVADKVFHVQRTLQRIQNQGGAERKTKIVVTTPKSSCSIRTIPIPVGLLNVLEQHKISSCGYVLTNHESVFVEPRTMQNHFAKALRESGIEKANFHITRHTFATRCIELGFDVKSLSEILGHATVTITMNRYVHPTMDLKQENMQRLSDLFAVE